MTRSIPKVVLYVICVGCIAYHIAAMIHYYATIGKDNMVTAHIPSAILKTGNATIPLSIRAHLGANAACVWLASLGLFGWVVYTFLTIILWKSPTNGYPVYTLEGIQHVAVYVYIFLGGIFGATHYILLTTGHFFWLNLTMLALSAFCYMVSIFKASLDHEKFRNDLIQVGVTKQLGLVKMFVVNALLPVAAWMLIELFTGVTELVKYELFQQQQRLMTAMLVTILVVFILIFALELFFRDYGFYFLLHYVVIFMYAIGVIVMTRGVPKSSTLYILPLVLVVVSVLQIFVKLTLIFTEARKTRDHVPL